MIDLEVVKQDKIRGMRILVTGGAGFIGSHIVENLLEIGCPYVRVLDNLSTGKIANLSGILESYKERVEFRHGDIGDLEVCRSAVDGIDVVCHQAAIGSVLRSVHNPLASHKSNVDGTFNMLLACKERGIKRFVYASSSSIYGDNDKLPKKETEVGRQMSPYAVTKYIDELYAQIFTRMYEMECIGFRYFNVFGPRQDPNGMYASVIPRFITELKRGERVTINGDGSFSRDFTYVENVVLANILGMTTENKECFGEAFNVGIYGRVSILELYQVIKKHLGSELEPKFGEVRKGDVPHSQADVSKATELLGYRPIVSFEEGICRTIESFN